VPIIYIYRSLFRGEGSCSWLRRRRRRRRRRVMGNFQKEKGKQNEREKGQKEKTPKRIGKRRVVLHLVKHHRGLLYFCREGASKDLLAQKNGFFLLGKVILFCFFFVLRIHLFF
jgi:hypothetical protein